MEQLIYFCSSCIDLLLTVIYFDMLLGHRKSDITLRLWSIAFVVLEVILSINVIILKLFPDFQFFSLFSLATGTLYLYLLTKMYPATFRHRMFVTLSYQLFCMLGEVISYFVISGIFPNVQSDTTVFVLFCSKLFICLFVFLCGAIYRNHKSQVSYTYNILLLLNPTICIFVVHFIFLCIDSSTTSAVNTKLSGVIYLMLSLLPLLNYPLLNYIISNQNMKKRESFLQNQLHMQKEKYQENLTAYKNTWSILHDEKKHLLYLKEAALKHEQDALLNYLEEHIAALEQNHFGVNTGNLAIDALVSNCIRNAETYGITVTRNLQVANTVIPLPDYDLTIILGNLLDNAVNAAKLMPVADAPSIEIEIFSTPRELVIHVTNSTVLSTPEQIRPDEAYLSSLTEPTLHGYGLINIYRMVQKNEGTSLFEQAEKCFSSTCIIPLKGSDQHAKNRRL